MSGEYGISFCNKPGKSNWISIPNHRQPPCVPVFAHLWNRPYSMHSILVKPQTTAWDVLLAWMARTYGIYYSSLQVSSFCTNTSIDHLECTRRQWALHHIGINKLTCMPPWRCEVAKHIPLYLWLIENALLFHSKWSRSIQILRLLFISCLALHNVYRSMAAE